MNLSLKIQYPGDIGIVEVERLSLFISLTCFFVVMDKNLESYELLEDTVTMKDPMTVTKTGQGNKSNKCNQCDYASSQKGTLMRHFKTHSGEKLNKCNLCDFASAQANDLIRHFKIHSGAKSIKCN